MASINAINSGIPIEIEKGGTLSTSLTDHCVLVGSGIGAITPITAATDGQVLIGSSGADPVFASITSSGGTITITPGAGTLNLDAIIDLTPWTEITTATTTLVVNEGVVMNRATAITATLPATALFGEFIKIAGQGDGLTIIAQNANQTIHYGSSSTTIGVGGSLTATTKHDCLEMICIVAGASTEWLVRSGIGNWQIV